MREIRGDVFQGRFHNLLISKNNTFWVPQISRITFQVVFQTSSETPYAPRGHSDSPVHGTGTREGIPDALDGKAARSTGRAHQTSRCAPRADGGNPRTETVLGAAARRA